jgi:O-antigen/teichoic acid export membrane protein
VEIASHRRPALGRDAGWLLGAEIISVFLAFFGQIILTRTLLPIEYGWLVLAIDVYASLFLITDLGLPTLLARDGSNRPQAVRHAVWRTYKMQGTAFGFFLLLALIIQPLDFFGQDAPQFLAILGILISFIHIASYSPRTALRSIGHAHQEAISKVIERTVIVCGYLILFWYGSEEVILYALVFFIGGCVSVFYSLFILHNLTSKAGFQENSEGLSPDWISNRVLFYSALPFAITLSILPYVIRIEKFMIALVSNVDAMAVFHVAQLAWLAGLVVPAALRSSLLPVLGAHRHHPEQQHTAMDASLDICLGILPIGLFSGFLIVEKLAPIAFPKQYFDGSLGGNAIELFTVLLLGWAATILATPTYTRLQTHHNPWRFTIFIAIVALTAMLVGWFLVVSLASSSHEVLMMASLAATLSAIAMLVYSIVLSHSWNWVKQRRDDWILATMSSVLIVVGLLSSTLIWLFGLPLFLFIPRAVRAVKSTLS